MQVEGRRGAGDGTLAFGTPVTSVSADNSLGGRQALCVTLGLTSQLPMLFWPTSHSRELLGPVPRST